MGGVAERGWSLRLPAVEPRSLAHGAALALLALIGLGTLTAIGAVSLLDDAPRWWRSVDPGDPATRLMGERIENGVASALHARREHGEPWTVAVTAPQANAWLNTMLPRWVENRDLKWPERLLEVQTNFEKGVLAVGLRVLASEGEERFVSLKVAPVVGADGSLWLTPVGAAVGRVGVPVRWSVDWIWRELPEEARRDPSFMKAVVGEAPILPDASVDLQDGRRVRLTDIQTKRGRMLITCVTDRPAD